MKKIKKIHIPRNLTLQWHITERCNLRCKHCYHTKYDGSELSFEELVKVLNQYKDLLKYWRNYKKVGAHINITGGEPFTREDFFDFLELLSNDRDCFSFAILTNGTLIDSKFADKIKRLDPVFVQISIEGKKETHDRIRGDGNFENVKKSLKELIKRKIPTCISFTAHKGNFSEFPNVVQLAKSLGVKRVWSDRMLPSGSGKSLEILNSQETCDFFEQMKNIKNKSRGILSKTEVSMHRSLQFHASGGRPYRCSAGDSLIAIQSNGDLYPCRRMPIKVGNVLEKDISEIYYESKILSNLRDDDIISKGCEKCFYSKLCNGGLRCLSYSLLKDPFMKDPGCWIKCNS